MTPRFPPRNTPEYWTFIEHWLMVERVDNERQWYLLRQASAIVSGLDPIQLITEVGLPLPPGGSGSGSGSGSGRASCACGGGTSTRTVVLSGYTGDCATFNGTHVCSNASSSSECEWIGTTIRAVYTPGSGNWSIYCLSTGGRITNWSGTCAGFASFGTNNGDGGCCSPSGTGFTGIHI